MTLIADKVGMTKADMVLMENISWEAYEKLLRDRDAAGQRVRITYDRGRVVIMSPLPIHEQIKRLQGRMIELATLERNIPCASYGSTTWKREDLLAGMEPDECYYIGREPDFDKYKHVDLRVEAAPDLVIEVDITHHPLQRLNLYAKLGVREAWRYDGKRVHFYFLDPSRQYRDIARSEVLPFLSADDVNRFVAMLSTSGETATLRAFRDWLRQPHPNS